MRQRILTAQDEINKARTLYKTLSHLAKPMGEDQHCWLAATAPRGQGRIAPSWPGRAAPRPAS